MTLSQSLFRIVLTTVTLLLIPLVAMQFTSGVNWTLLDFAVAGALLFGAGLTYVLLTRTAAGTAYRLAAAVAVAAGLLLVWGNLAVGFIGSEHNPANLLYGAVLVVAAVGAFAARLRPRGMARAMVAAALTQFAVPSVAMLIWQPALTLSVLWAIVLNTGFAGLWALSGWLFRRAAGPDSRLSQRLL